MAQKSFSDFKKPSNEDLESEMLQLAVEIDKVNKQFRKQCGISTYTFDQFKSVTGLTESQQMKLSDTYDHRLSILLRQLLPFGYTLTVVPKKRANIPEGAQPVINAVLEGLNQGGIEQAISTLDNIAPQKPKQQPQKPKSKPQVNGSTVSKQYQPTIKAPAEKQEPPASTTADKKPSLWSRLTKGIK